MTDNKMSEILQTSINNLKSVMGADTIIGEPIKTEVGTVIIPVSKMSVGFVSGGLDYAAKTNDKKNNFGGGGGTGLTLTPVCFLVVEATGSVNILNINSPARTQPDPVSDIVGLVEKSPDIINKIKNTFAKKEETGVTEAE